MHSEYLHICITGCTQTSAFSLPYQRDLKPPKWHIFTVRNRLHAFIPHPPNYSFIQILIRPPVYLLTFTTIFLHKTLSFTHTISVLRRVTDLQLEDYFLMEPYLTETWGFGLAHWICPYGSSKTHFSTMADMFDSSSYVSNGRQALKNKHPTSQEQLENTTY